MKHINEYNIFDNVALSWESTQEDADDLAETLKYNYDLKDEDVKVTKMSEGIYSIQLKSTKTNDGHIYLGLTMSSNQLSLYVKSDYTIGDIHDYSPKEWKVVPDKNDENWEDLVYKVRYVIDKALQHVEEVETLEQKLKAVWNESTYDYPMKKNISMEDGKVIYNV